MPRQSFVGNSVKDQFGVRKGFQNHPFQNIRLFTKNIFRDSHILPVSAVFVGIAKLLYDHPEMDRSDAFSTFPVFLESDNYDSSVLK